MTDQRTDPSNVISLAAWRRVRDDRAEETYEKLIRDEVLGLEAASPRQLLEEVHIASARARRLRV